MLYVSIRDLTTTCRESRNYCGQYGMQDSNFPVRSVNLQLSKLIFWVTQSIKMASDHSQRRLTLFVNGLPHKMKHNEVIYRSLHILEKTGLHILHTDHESLKWLFTRTQEHSGRLWQWLDKFKVHHTAGNKNTVVDALSRIQMVDVGEKEDWSLEYIKRQQDASTVIKEVKTCLSGKIPQEKEVHGKEAKVFHKELPKLVMDRDNILRHKGTEGSEATQIVLPSTLRQRVSEMLHDGAGHLGATKTGNRIRVRYFWSFMFAEIDSWCKKCTTCQHRRNPIPGRRAPLQPIITSRPTELVNYNGHSGVSQKQSREQVLPGNDRSLYQMVGIISPAKPEIRNDRKEDNGWMNSSAWSTGTVAQRPRYQFELQKLLGRFVSGSRSGKHEQLRFTLNRMGRR